MGNGKTLLNHRPSRWFSADKNPAQPVLCGAESELLMRTCGTPAQVLRAAAPMLLSGGRTADYFSSAAASAFGASALASGMVGSTSVSASIFTLILAVTVGFK